MKIGLIVGALNFGSYLASLFLSRGLHRHQVHPYQMTNLLARLRSCRNKQYVVSNGGRLRSNLVLI